MKNSILSKIQKLAAKAESAKELGNLAEATAFSAKVSEMLTTHNLAMSDINVEDEDEVNGFDERDLGLTSSQGRWTISLLTVLCKHNYCDSVYTQTGKKDYKVTIIGQPENVEVVKYLYSVLKRQFETIAKQEWKTYLEQKRAEIQKKHVEEGAVTPIHKKIIAKPWKYFYGVISRSKYTTSFFKGAVSGVSSKLNAQRKEAEKLYGSKITDMVIVKDADVKEYMRKAFPDLGTFSTRKSTVNREAYNNGVKAGSNASMARGIANGQSVATKMIS